MNLAIFDIDGTLTATSNVDADCFEKAIYKQYGIDASNIDWGKFKHFTDSNIFSEIFAGNKGREPLQDEKSAMEACFISLLKKEQKRAPDLFQAIPGAIEMVDWLLNESDWSIALATGSWRSSAELKLEHVGLLKYGLPLATSDVLHAREDIMLNAIDQAQIAYNHSAFERIVYVGDGIWDARCSRKLNFNFIGVQYEKRHQALDKKRTSYIISDYRDLEYFQHALEKATIPNS